jgi:hypothetical protein
MPVISDSVMAARTMLKLSIRTPKAIDPAKSEASGETLWVQGETEHTANMAVRIALRVAAHRVVPVRRVLYLHRLGDHTLIVLELLHGLPL